MSCDFPRCECLCHPDDCAFLEKNRIGKGKTMNDEVSKEHVLKAEAGKIGVQPPKKEEQQEGGTDNACPPVKEEN
jgi:hypothetical protein